MLRRFLLASAAAACVLAQAAAPATAQDTACAVPAPVGSPPAPGWAGELRGLATGAGVRVAVIDTGVTPSPELDQLVPGADFVVPEAPQPLRDCDAHGTVVAGIIAANTVGIAPEAEVISIRQTSAHYRSRESDDPAGDEPSSGNLRTLADAIHNALDLGAHVINMSVVSCVDPRVAPRVDTSGLDAALNRAEEQGAVVVAAAGNLTGECRQGSRVFPAHSPTVLTVGSRSDDYSLADYSVAIPDGAVALSARGHAPVAPSPDGNGWAEGTYDQQGEVIPFEGTSFAAPVITGSVALLKQRRPELTPAQVREIVAAAAEPNGGAIDPVDVASQLAPEVREPASPLVIEPVQQPASAAPRRWLLVAAGLAAATFATLAGAAVRRPSGQRKQPA